MNPTFLAAIKSNATFTGEALDAITYTHDYWIFLAPLLLNAVDVVTGWIQATINGCWKSTKMRYGIMRKAGMMLIIILAYCFEYAIEAVHEAHVATFVSVYIVVMELLSICENLDHAGVPIPGFIRNRLGKVKERMEEKGNEEEQ